MTISLGVLVGLGTAALVFVFAIILYLSSKDWADIIFGGVIAVVFGLLGGTITHKAVTVAAISRTTKKIVAELPQPWPNLATILQGEREPRFKVLAIEHCFSLDPPKLTYDQYRAIFKTVPKRGINQLKNLLEPYIDVKLEFEAASKEKESQ